jgi:hypothetical protein
LNTFVSFLPRMPLRSALRMVHDDRTSLAARLAAAALLPGFEVQQLAGLQVTGISRFRD